MKTIIAVLAVVVIVLGSLLTLRAEGGPSALSGAPAVYGPAEVKEMAIQWTDRDEETLYPDRTRLTVFSEWIRIEEMVQRSPRKYDVMIVPRSRVRQIIIIKP